MKMGEITRFFSYSHTEYSKFVEYHLFSSLYVFFKKPKVQKMANPSLLVLLFIAIEKLTICQKKNLCTSYFKLQTELKHELEVKDYSECQLFKDMNL